ncbi:MAG: hypothetical protein KGK12_08420 [Armatimonadetes bacterium]|nr:hypothetical protein [Armatimonadota bacterium]
MQYPRFGSGTRSRFGMLMVASVAAIGAVCGCGGGVNGAPLSSAAVSSTPRSAAGLLFTASADHAVYAGTARITLTYSITNPGGIEPTVSTGGWFFADATDASQTVHLIGSQIGGFVTGSGGEIDTFTIYNNETVSYPVPDLTLPPGRWQIACWLAGSIGGVFDGQQPPYAYATNPVTITVLR